MEECKIGNTLYYGYFDNPSDFNPDKGVKEGLLVEEDEEDYEVLISDVKSRKFVNIPKYCHNSVESVSSLDYPDSYVGNRYFCYGLDKDKVKFQLSFKALSIINGEYTALEKRLEKLRLVRDKLQEELGVCMEDKKDE